MYLSLLEKIGGANLGRVKLSERRWTIGSGEVNQSGLQLELVHEALSLQVTKVWLTVTALAGVE